MHKNKSKFLLVPFLLFSVTTHCMKEETEKIVSSIIVKPANMRKLQSKRNLLQFTLTSWDTKFCGLPEKKDSKNAQDAKILTTSLMCSVQDDIRGPIFLRYVYYYNDQIISHNHRRDRFTLGYLLHNNAVLTACRNARLQECSAFSVITIAPHLTFKEKKEFARMLRYYNFVPTLEDKDFAFVEKLKRCASLYIKKIWPLSCALDVPEIPHELIKKEIALLMFEKEESLF
jgi:hypothetical protein